MVVDVAVGDGNPLAGMRDVDETVVVVLAGVEVARNVHMVDPDVLGGLDANAIAVVGRDFGDLQVAHDDVGHLVDVETDAGQA